MTETAFKIGSTTCKAILGSSYCYDYAAMTVTGYGLAVIVCIVAFLCVALQKGTG